MIGQQTKHFVVACAAVGLVLATTGALYFKAHADHLDQVRVTGVDLPRVSVSVYRVEPQQRHLRFQARGLVKGIEEVVVSAEISGLVLERLVREGQVVRCGDPLCRIDPTFHELAAAAAAAVLQERQSAVASAEAELQRLEEISDQAKAAIEINRLTTALDRARAAAELAAAELGQAREQQRRSLIAAPLDGVVSAVFVEKGELLAPGRPVVEIIDLRQLKLQISLTPSEVAQLGPDPQVQVTASAYPDDIFAGRVEAIHPKADPATRRVPVQVVIDNPDGRLRSGTFVDCAVICQTSFAKLLIPSKGILHDFASDYGLVAVPSDDGFTVKRREISTRSVADSVAVVEALDGLAPGDLLILTHQQEIQLEQIIDVTPQQTPGS